MKIETTYDIGDSVFFKVDGGIVKSEINRIGARVLGAECGATIRYHTVYDGDDAIMRVEFTLHKTIEECESDPSP